MALTLALVAETLQRTEILAHELAFTLAGLGILGLPFLARGLNRRMGKPGGHFGLFVVVFTLLFVFVDASPETRQESYWLNHISALIVGAFIARGGFHLQSAIRKRVELAPVEGESSS